MLAIRMQRVGRKGHPEFRVVVQDARLNPSSGRVVARVGHYNPHTKAITIDKEKIEQYLGNGAQPSPRVVRMLQAEKVKLPDWVKLPKNDQQAAIKNPDKLRRNRPAEEAPVEETPVEEAAPATEAVAEETSEVAETPAVEEAPAEETASVEVAATPETAETPEAEEPKADA